MNPFLPLSALNQYAYCPRRCWWIHVMGEFPENAFTLEGKLLHKRVHDPGRTSRGPLQRLRRVYVFSHRLGIAGFADVLELQGEEGFPVPVEHKRGRRAPWKRNDHIQLCAQALCLEEMLRLPKPIPYGFLYYAGSGRRLRVPLTDELRTDTLRTIEEVRRLLRGEVEPPARYSNRCRGCSLYPVCLPRETDRLRRQALSSPAGGDLRTP